ncbi:hypothetical protein, partial [Prevotella sp. C561]|uniref:hypothetical protein n=1 Tax=Prevotella sp. C561 TaxID=563031 RepID=UPI00350FE3BC
KKANKGNSEKSFVYRGCTARLARVCVKKKVGRLGLAYMRERERESIQIFGTTKYFAIFLSSFLLSVLNDSATGTTATTPLS